jgi:NADH-quinone oxidoreductase subunit E
MEFIDKNHAVVETILDSYGGESASLVSILQDIQSEYNYLPEDALRQVAGSLGLPLIQVYGVATFFKAFSLKPKGRHQCTVCMGTACHVRGAGLVVEELERRLKIKAGDTTEDMEYSLETVNCVGACALGPVVIIDGEYYGNMNSAKVEKMLKGHEKKSAKTTTAVAKAGKARAKKKAAKVKKAKTKKPAKRAKSKGAVKSGPKPGKKK